MKPSLRMPMADAYNLIAEANNAHDMAQIICEIAECAFQLGYQLGRKPTPKLRQIAPGIMAMELQDCEELANVLAGLDPSTPVYDASELCPDGLRELGRQMAEETLAKPRKARKIGFI